MQNTGSNDSTGNIKESPEWIHVMINRSSSTPPTVVKQERRLQTPEDNPQHVVRNVTPTSPDYSGPPKREVAHASLSWTDSVHDGCQIHLNVKQGLGWYPQSSFTKISRQPSVAHDNDWLQEMEANPGEDWVPQQQPQRRRGRRAHHEIMSWEPCFNARCNDHWWEKMEAGYYPWQVREKRTLAKNDRREHKWRRAVRTQRGRERRVKTIRDVKALERAISDLRSRLDRAAQIIVAKDNHLELLDREKEATTSLQSSQTENTTDRRQALERRSLASWNWYKRGKVANITNGD